MKFVLKDDDRQDEPQVHPGGHPRVAQGRGRGVPRAAARSGLARRRRAARADPRRQAGPEEMLLKAPAQGHAGGQVHAGLLRLVEEVPRRAACCSTPSSITCRRPLDRPPVEGIVPEDQGKGRCASRTRRSRSAAWRSRPSPSRPATWCTSASTPASCKPKGETC